MGESMDAWRCTWHSSKSSSSGPKNFFGPGRQSVPVSLPELLILIETPRFSRVCVFKQVTPDRASGIVPQISCDILTFNFGKNKRGPLPWISSTEHDRIPLVEVCEATCFCQACPN